MTGRCRYFKSVTVFGIFSNRYVRISGVTIIFAPPGKHSLRANSLDLGHFGPLYCFRPLAPRYCRGCRWLVTPLFRISRYLLFRFREIYSSNSMYSNRQDVESFAAQHKLYLGCGLSAVIKQYQFDRRRSSLSCSEHPPFSC